METFLSWFAIALVVVFFLAVVWATEGGCLIPLVILVVGWVLLDHMSDSTAISGAMCCMVVGILLAGLAAGAAL